MHILGLQKLTLLDYPEHLAATLFLGGCSFRCPFCHNSELVLYEDHRNRDPDLLTSGNISPMGSETVLFPDNRSSHVPDCKRGSSPENKENLYSEDEILGFLKKRNGMLDGVCISGGEPTLHRDLPALISRIKELGYDVKLDTNGANPDMLRELLNSDLLDYIAMDIKAGHKNYAAAAGMLGNTFLAANCNSASSAATAKNSPDDCPGSGRSLMRRKTESDSTRDFPLSEQGQSGSGLLMKIQRSIDMIRNSGVDYEFRTTVVKGIHTEEDFADIAQWLAGSKRYYLQSFRDCDTILLPNHNFSAFTEKEMLHFLSIIKKTIPGALLRGMET